LIFLYDGDGKIFKNEGVLVLKQGRPKEQLFAELVALQRDVEKNLEAQEQFIKRFQLLVLAEDDPLTVINLFSCPVALYKKHGILYKMNQSLMENTDLRESDLSEGSIRFLDRITNENFAMLEAVQAVFYGKTSILSSLSHPLELFCKSWSYPTSDDYHSAFFFPLPVGKGDILQGAVMLLK
jgi:hypothetical protein